MLGGVSKEDQENEDEQYENVATLQPATWFSVNTVGCLRSKYIYKEKDFCVPFVRGKEYLMKVNKAWGAHYVQQKLRQSSGYFSRALSDSCDIATFHQRSLSAMCQWQC
jgi:hypothetical protein